MSQLFGLHAFVDRALDNVAKALRVDHATKPAPLTTQERAMLYQASDLLASVRASLQGRME